MNPTRCRILFLGGVAFFIQFAGIQLALASGWKHGVVASVNSRATDVGVEVLKQGGNAIDAAVAVGLMLGVVETENSGIGAGCFMLIRTAKGELIAIDGRETAPAAATRDMFIRGGAADTKLSQSGALAIGVPGALAAYDYAVAKFGRKNLSELLSSAAHVAEKGFPLPASYADRLAAEQEVMRKFPATKAIFFKRDRPLKEGDWLRQRDLAATYRAIAEQGISWFYSGPFSVALDRWMKVHGGIMTADDLRKYRIRLRQPVISTYRGCEIVGFGPPSSGGVHVAEILNIFENFNLAKMSQLERIHVMGESMKLAFADRAFWLGDPDFANVPLGLIDVRYGRELASKIDLERSIPVTNHGYPPDWEHCFFGKHTTHFCVADAEGNWVSCTATLNTSFGSKVVIPGTGVIMNNQMDDFSIQPGVANFFGLVGGEANEIAPGKRPLSSMSPTIVLKNDRPIIALGAAGGPKIITTVVDELVNMLDLHLSAEEAVKAPRIHHQWTPNELFLERPLQKNSMQLLKMGHQIQLSDWLGTSQIISRDAETGTFSGAADPRANGKAAGW